MDTRRQMAEAGVADMVSEFIETNLGLSGGYLDDYMPRNEFQEALNDLAVRVVEHVLTEMDRRDA